MPEELAVGLHVAVGDLPVERELKEMRRHEKGELLDLFYRHWRHVLVFVGLSDRATQRRSVGSGDGGQNEQDDSAHLDDGRCGP